MAIEQTKPEFRTSDGRKFETREEAERHEVLKEAETAYNETKQRYEHALCQSKRTKDGHLFQFMWRDYYYVRPGWAGMPYVEVVSFYGNFILDDGTDEVTFCVPTDQDKYRRYKISELYTDIHLANAELMRETAQWIAERVKDMQEMAVKLGVDVPVVADQDELLAVARVLIEPIESLVVGVVPEWDENIEKMRAIVERAKIKENE